MELSSNNIGAAGELIVATEFLKHGFDVYSPMVDTGADMLVDTGEELWRVQVKTYGGSDESHTFKLLRRNPRGRGWKEYEGISVDWYALVYLQREYIALVRPEGRRVVFISFGPRGEKNREEIEIGHVLGRLKEK